MDPYSSILAWRIPQTEEPLCLLSCDFFFFLILLVVTFLVLWTDAFSVWGLAQPVHLQSCSVLSSGALTIDTSDFFHHLACFFYVLFLHLLSFCLLMCLSGYFHFADSFHFHLRFKGFVNKISPLVIHKQIISIFIRELSSFLSVY